MNYYKQGHIDFSIVFLLAIGFIIGSFLGSKFAMQLPQQTVKKIFASLMLIIAIKMLFFDNAGKKPETHNTTVSNVTSGKA